MDRGGRGAAGSGVAGAHARPLALAERGFGFDFDFAALIFLGRTLLKSDDRRDYGEVRQNALGEIDGDLYPVTFTDRGSVR